MWGTHRYTDTREPIYGEGYIQIPQNVAKRLEIFNNNKLGAEVRYECHSIDGLYSGTLLAQGCSQAGEIYAKQFAEAGNLKGIGRWYEAVAAKENGEVEVVFTSSNSMTIKYID